MSKKEILAGLKEVGFYEFIAQNYWRLTKDELKDIALEITFASYEASKRGGDYFDNIEASAIEELEERLVDDDE